MKIGVLSDTHLSASSQKLADDIAIRFSAEEVDLILHAGDITNQAVLQRLEKIAPVKAVAGNMDPPDLKAQLPNKLVLTADGLRIGLIHGNGPPNRLGERLLPTFDGDEVDVLVFGHSHEARNEEYRGVLLFNPGSASHGRSGSPSFGMLTIENGKAIGEIIRITA